MGKNSKARRAAKKKKRAARASSRPKAEESYFDPLFGFSDGEPSARSVFDVVYDAIDARELPASAVARADAAVVALGEHGIGAIEQLTAQVLQTAWAGHWLPGELLRHVERKQSKTEARFVSVAVAGEQSRWKPNELHPQWRQHVANLGLPQNVPAAGWFERARLQAGVSAREGVSLALNVLAAMSSIPELKEVVPAPGSRAARKAVVTMPSDGSSAMLSKIRMLLNQAESTKFEAEAEAFTAKAQTLMSRHSIDEAMLWAQAGKSERPQLIRLPVDDPYADTKALLMNRVARAGRCRSVYFAETATVEVLGFSSDLAAVETLFTSLLVQSQAALLRQAVGAQPGSRVRSARYRASFMSSFAVRIGERLQEVADATVTDAVEAEGESLLPVLAGRVSAVEDAFKSEFPNARATSVRGGYDPLGRVDGRQAADDAKLKTEALS